MTLRMHYLSDVCIIIYKANDPTVEQQALPAKLDVAKAKAIKAWRRYSTGKKIFRPPKKDELA